MFLGIDFGTSGARGNAITESGQLLYEVKATYDREQSASPEIWKRTLGDLIQEVPSGIRQQLQAISINGTSGTVFLCDRTGTPCSEVLLYNDDRGREYLGSVTAIAPTNSIVISATSSLVKLAWLAAQTDDARAQYFCHQADWLGFLLHGQLGISDYHNALKVGFDVEALQYPAWLKAHPQAHWLPRVLAPGTVVSQIRPDVAEAGQINPACRIATGTTDSIAAFLASGAQNPGDAVTSLGSTLVIKLLSRKRLEEPQYGIYSHRLGDLWLTGGASNTGGAVLQNFFTPEQINQLCARINPNILCDLDYYPLLKPGERFPLSAPLLPPRLTPRPREDSAFLYGLLSGIARIEAQGYQRLKELGATPVGRILTAGGGATNTTWQKIRAQYLPLFPEISTQMQAAYGTALLAKSSLKNSSK
ncbi:MAG: FGGY-family carbohydrate kinase [Cyanobacteria bacterium P01_H01_bin.15]